MTLATNLGFPRIGVHRELKKAQEAFWSGQSSEAALELTAKELRLRHWRLQKQAQLDHIPCNDFSLYDHVLDHCCLVGCIPQRYNWTGSPIDNALYFTTARGNDKASAMDMTKWFDTNYHYLVPEFEKNQRFTLSSNKIFDEYAEAKKAGIETRPLLLGLISFLSLGKADTLRWTQLLQALLPVYEQILTKLASLGVAWVQLDEPCLVYDTAPEKKSIYSHTYQRLAQAAGNIKILLATYFEGIEENQDIVLRLPVQAIHLDLCRAPAQLAALLPRWPAEKMLSLGLIDGRNIWKTDLRKALGLLTQAIDVLGAERLMVAPSCSLLHVPINLEQEQQLDPQLKSWMAFAYQKLEEIVGLAKSAKDSTQIRSLLQHSDAIVADRKNSSRIYHEMVQKKLAAVTPELLKRNSPYSQRQQQQQQKHHLPLYPITTIGSFPQTGDIRTARAAFKKGQLNLSAYNLAMKAEIARVVRYQETIELDVLVHGEAERNDMVEYFAEQLHGFALTANGWVQSYGSRCVKPPIIFGDVSRSQSMTLYWSAYAQNLTKNR